MKTTTFKYLLPSVITLALAMIGTSASANSTWTYNLSSQCDPSTNSGTYVANCNNLTTPVLDLTMSGWSTGAGTVQSPTVGTNFESAKIYDWGGTNGLGVVAKNEDPNATGPHAIDNKYGTDAILFNFTTAVSLSSFTLGWNGTDNFRAGSDVSVLAYTGTTPPADPTTGLQSQSITGLLNSGWQLVGNYGAVGAQANNTQSVTTAVNSSWWLISAYNPSYTISGTPVSSNTSALGAGKDYFKLLSVAGGISPPTKTPEPGSIALAGLGLVGLLAFRRSRKPA